MQWALSSFIFNRALKLWQSLALAGPKTVDVVHAELGKSFELVETLDMPFLIREHARKFQWGCSDVRANTHHAPHAARIVVRL